MLTPTHITYLTLAGLYLVLAGVAYKRIRHNPAGRPWLILYLLLAATFLIFRFGFEIGWFDLDQRWLAPDWTATLGLSLNFYYLTHAFFQESSRDKAIWPTARVVTPLLLLIIISALLPFHWPDSAWISLGSIALALLAWAIITGKTAWLVRRRLVAARRQPLHRNRVAYWFIITVFVASADLLFFIRRDQVAEFIRFAGVLIALYATLALHQGDIQRLTRRIAGYLLTSATIAVIYLGGLWLASFLGYGPTTQLMLILTLLCALAFRPTYVLLRRLVGRLTPHMVHQSGAWMVGEYSHRISKLVELNRLEAEVFGLLSQGMGLDHGTLFLVDMPNQYQRAYIFRSAQGSNRDRYILGQLDLGDPVAQFLSQRRRPLTQYEIDVLPRFKESDWENRQWLADMGFDVYIPIFLQDDWIGLLALGPKSSGQPYDSFELEVLASIADQTAVALENSRLFDNLVVVNHELQQALTDLEKANSKLQESDKLKSAFISVVSHELRTPFANVGFSLNLIERYGTESWPEEQREELVNLQNGIEKARKMVADLVTFATFLSKKGQLELADLDFPSLMAEIAQVMEPLAGQKGLQLRVGARRGDPFSNGHAPNVTGDRERLVEAVHHLVQNAVKFTPENGLVDISYWTEADRAFVCVSDNGVGIPADRLDGIWEGFNQMADPVRRGAEGLGLGLPLVLQVVRAHGGDVWVESEIDQGSRFGFWVPLGGPPDTGQRQQRRAPTPTPEPTPQP